MKKIVVLLFALTTSSFISAQDNNEFKFGKVAEASIHLTDSEMTVSEDGTNSVVRFEISNNSTFPIYIAQPEIQYGTVPQYFNLVTDSIECIFEDSEMVARSSSEFILISAKSSKQFELKEDFYRLSCISNDKPSKATLVYRAFNFEFQDQFLADELMKKDRASRDIVEYILTSSLKSRPIKITYQ